MKKAVFIMLLCFVSFSAFAKIHTLSFGVNAHYSDIVQNQKVDALGFIEFVPAKSFFLIRAEGGASFLNNMRYPVSLGIGFKLFESESLNFIVGADGLLKIKSDSITITPLGNLRLGIKFSKLLSLEIGVKAGYQFQLKGQDDFNQIYLSAGAGFKFSFDVGFSESERKRKYDDVYYERVGNSSYITYVEKDAKKEQEESKEDKNIVMTQSELDELLEAQRAENLANSIAENYIEDETGNPKELIRQNQSENYVDVKGKNNFFGVITKYVYRKDKVFNVYCTVRNITDIRLKDTEEIVDVKIADPLGSWTTEVYTNFDEGKQYQHIMFIPNKVNIKTDCEIFTTERTYILSLISTDDNTYQQVLEWVYTGEDRSIQKNSFVNSNEGLSSTLSQVDYLENCIFNYKITGDTFWKPKRVYSDTNKTYIQFANNFKANNVAPAVVLRDLETGKDINVNVLVKGITYVLPLVLGASQELELIYGDESIRIEREY